MGAGSDTMAKPVRLRTAEGKLRKTAVRPLARGRTTAPAVAVAAGPTMSDPMRLAAEVARLEAELAAMRARVAELETHAERDPLTDVMNRRGFERELRRADAYVRRYGGNAALVYLDLDGFKPVNDRHGHAAGDAVLRAVAAALVAAVRVSDTVARIGGDEFAVLLWYGCGAQQGPGARAGDRRDHGRVGRAPVGGRRDGRRGRAGTRSGHCRPAGAGRCRHVCAQAPQGGE
jgi:hypothetical protein